MDIMLYLTLVSNLKTHFMYCLEPMIDCKFLFVALQIQFPELLIDERPAKPNAPKKRLILDFNFIINEFTFTL